MEIVGHSKWMRKESGELGDEKELGRVGVKRREQALAWFEALVVCGEVLVFSPLLQRDMSSGVGVLF
ncbi:hypothetical protein CesoFtcFv8_018474 [Champsocephalus esox]|uniref:Uncharacterized protein n=2 Tax=Champsocephalus TaxID=52236 RepID=A0AAN8D3F5_CHAGU|nr:hypothetical protein CesoFtcFv8_018474 [Champsocephalus esox]KAK5913750.1 hypothetical protein CgunFtcFv8_008251 [Champsocephalus gunnari]